MATENFNPAALSPKQARHLAEELHEAINKHQDVSRIACLIRQGADIEARCGALGETALLRAILCRQEQIALYLIDNGADVRASALSGRANALIYSVMFGHYDDITQKLLDKGVHPDSSAANEKTALIWAAQDAKWSRARLLIKHGASIHLRDDKGKTAIDYAQENHGHAAAKKLVDLYEEVHANDPIKVMKALSLKKPAAPEQEPAPAADPVFTVEIPAKPAKKTIKPKI
jgi:ankyrin repeat protein